MSTMLRSRRSRRSRLRRGSAGLSVAVAAALLAWPAALAAQETGNTDTAESEAEIDVDTLPPDPDTVDPESPDVQAAADAAEAWLRLVDAGDFQQAWATGASVLQIALSPQVLSATINDGRGRFEPPAARSLIGFRMLRNPANAAPGDYVLLRYRAHPTEGHVLLETVSTKRDGDAWRVVGYDATRE